MGKVKKVVVWTTKQPKMPFCVLGSRSSGKRGKWQCQSNYINSFPLFLEELVVLCGTLLLIVDFNGVKRQFWSPSSGQVREEAPRPCTGGEPLGPPTFGTSHQTAHIPNPSAASPLHLSAKHESSFLIVNRLAAHTFFRPQENWDHFTFSCTTGQPSSLHPKNSLTGINRPNQRRARIAAKNVWRDALLRGLSLPPWAADLKSGPWEGPARPRGGAAQVQVQGGAVACRRALHTCSTCARCSRPDPSELSWPAASQVLCSCRPCFAAAFSSPARSLLICGWGICWPARHAFLGAQVRQTSGFKQ